MVGEYIILSFTKKREQTLFILPPRSATTPPSWRRRMEILPTFQSTPTYVSARLSMKIKNYNLLSSVTLLGVIIWIWVINEVTAVGDGSVTANFAVTLPCFQWLLMGWWLVYIELFSFSRLKLLFLQLGTKVSSAWNFSSKTLKPRFRTLENIASSVGNEWNNRMVRLDRLYFPNNGWLVYL